MERQPIPVEEFAKRYEALKAKNQSRLSNFMEMLEEDEGLPPNPPRRPTSEAYGSLKGKIKILPGFDDPILDFKE